VEIKSMGDTVHVGRISNMTAMTKAYDTKLDFEAVTETKQDISIATHQYSAFRIERMADVQSSINLVDKYTKKIGYALARGRETALTALVASLSQFTGTLAMAPTEDDFLYIWQKLAEAGLLESSPDAGEEFSLFVSPATYADMLKIDVFANRQYNTAGDAIQRAKVGDVYGMPVFISNLLTSNGGGHDCLGMHKGCFALCVQDLVEVKSQYMLEYLANAVVGWHIYGTAELNYPPETAGGGAAVDNRGVWLKAK